MRLGQRVDGHEAWPECRQAGRGHSWRRYMSVTNQYRWRCYVSYQSVAYHCVITLVGRFKSPSYVDRFASASDRVVIGTPANGALSHILRT